MRLYSTMTRKVAELTPSNPDRPDGGEIGMYICGVNLYGAAHLGHAMSYIIFDVLRRYLEYRGYKVKHVQNFTDIEDKIIIRAQEDETTIDDLAERHMKTFHDDMEALNVRPAHLYPRATHEIPSIVEMIQGLIEKGYAYEAGGDVYFRVRKKSDYGKLSSRDVDDLLSGARIEVDESKEDPLDFALWKGAKPGEPSWESPFGQGRPGWHIECSAMSLHHLGKTLDIHGGGQDLIFPHHENEIAQSEAFTGVKPFARFWLHHGLMRLPDQEEKMTRSLGNLIPIREALDKYGVDGLRLFILSSHYRSPLQHSEDALGAGKRGAERLRLAATLPGGDGTPAVDPEPFEQRFVEAMDDDMNTPGAIAALFDLAREINRGRDESRDIAKAQSTLQTLATDVLGLRLEEPKTGSDIAPLIDLLVELRKDLREAKQFELADKVRERLEGLGIALEDGEGGTRWRRRD